jgi:flagellar biosynthetic protein FliR
VTAAEIHKALDGDWRSLLALIGPFAIVFCRVGACVAIAPGFASAQIPARVRLFVALGATACVAPMVAAQTPAWAAGGDVPALARAVAGEIAVGTAIGLLGRLFVAALDTAMDVACVGIGLANPFGVSLEPGDTLPPLATLASLAAAVLVVATDSHLELLRGLVLSFSIAPPGGGLDPGPALRRLVDGYGDAFRLALRVASPFLIYSIAANFAAGIVERAAAHMQLHAMATPLVLTGALVLAWFVMRLSLGEFAAQYARWALLG